MTCRSLIQARRRVADEEFSAFCFDSGMTITDSMSWDDTHSDDWAKIFYVEYAAEDQRGRCVMHVVFCPSSTKVAEAYALDLATGQMVGRQVGW